MNGPTLFDPLEPSDGRAKLRERIFQFLRDRAERGATDPEMQAALGLSGDSQRPRRVELEKDGLIQNSRQSRPSPSGSPCIVWVLSRHAPKPAERSPANGPPSARTIPHPPNPAPRRPTTAQAEQREKSHGAELDAMPTDALGRLCAALFPDWPQVFGMTLSPDAARSDPVCRRLLLLALVEGNPSGNTVLPA